jgi:hypothetical protein
MPAETAPPPELDARECCAACIVEVWRRIHGELPSPSDPWTHDAAELLWTTATDGRGVGVEEERLHRLARMIAGRDEYPAEIVSALRRAVMLVRERIGEEQTAEFAHAQTDIGVEISALAEVVRQSQAADPRVMMLALMHTLAGFVAFHFGAKGESGKISEAICKALPAMIQEAQAPQNAPDAPDAQRH